MIRVGLTGGIGAGKSVVAARMRELGAFVVDADAVAREVVRPGEPALAEIAAQFGPEVLDPDGTLRRAHLAGIVFGDPVALDRLNRIMAPRIAQRTAEVVAAAGEVPVLVYDMPLLVEHGLAGEYDEVVVVVAPVAVRLARLAARGIAAEDAQARMAAQASDAQRAAVATRVIDNSGPLGATLLQVDRLWAELLPVDPGSPGGSP